MKFHSEKDGHKEINRKQMGVKSLLKMSVCCLVPILAFLVLSALGFSASGLLLLACPLMMIYMMWMMRKMQQKERRASKAETPETLADTSAREVESTPQIKEIPSKNLVGTKSQK